MRSMVHESLGLAAAGNQSAAIPSPAELSNAIDAACDDGEPDVAFQLLELYDGKVVPRISTLLALSAALAHGG